MALRKVEKKTAKGEVLKIYKDMKHLLAFEKYESADEYRNPCPSTEFLCDLKYDYSLILIEYVQSIPYTYRVSQSNCQIENNNTTRKKCLMLSFLL